MRTLNRMIGVQVLEPGDAEPAHRFAIDVRQRREALLVIVAPVGEPGARLAFFDAGDARPGVVYTIRIHVMGLQNDVFSAYKAFLLEGGHHTIMLGLPAHTAFRVAVKNENFPFGGPGARTGKIELKRNQTNQCP